MTRVEAVGALPGGTRPLTEVRVPKSSDVLASSLRERILGGEIPIGTVLPPERMLMDQTGLSRGAVRESLRILEVQGLVEVRAGRSGGAVVCRPRRELLDATLDLVIRGRRIGASSLLEVRAAIEPSCASVAAKRGLPSELLELRRILRVGASTDSDTDFLWTCIEWHQTVARASGNELLAGLVTASCGPIHDAIAARTHESPKVRIDVLRDHQAVTDAVTARDSEGAARATRVHITASPAVAGRRAGGWR